ncbi:MAG: hypothetical protein WAW52_01795 [Methanothrix sp.]
MKKVFSVLLIVLLLTVLFVIPVSAQGATDPPFKVDQTEDALSVIVGVGLSLLFSYFPGVSLWYNTKLTGNYKRLVMMGAILLAVLVIYGMACYGLVKGVACTQAGFWDGAKWFVLTLISNQTTDRISPKIGNKSP